MSACRPTVAVVCCSYFVRSAQGNTLVRPVREGNMAAKKSVSRKSAAKKAAKTRKSQAAAKKAAKTRKQRAAGKKAAATRKRRTAAKKAVATRKTKAAVTRASRWREDPSRQAEKLNRLPC